MPTPRKAASLKALSGAHEHDPRSRRADVPATGGIGPWRPARSADPPRVWDELVSQCPPGVLKAADRVAVEMAVLLICEMRENPRTFGAAKCTQLLAVLNKLGCTPAARLGMAIPQEAPKDDPAERYFK